jgi:hypothetical protein
MNDLTYSVRLGAAVQMLYSEMMDRIRGSLEARSGVIYRGAYCVKTQGRYRSVYMMSRGGKESYVCPATPVIEAAIRDLRTTRQTVRDLANAFVAAGGYEVPKTARNVLRAIAAHPGFSQSGVLVGTHAFNLYQGSFSLLFNHGGMTKDMDFAGKADLAVAPIPYEESLLVYLAKAAPGLQPIYEHGACAFWKNETDRFDFLTTTESLALGQQPVFLPAFGVVAQPLPYLDYLLEYPCDALAIGGGEAILVRVPQPSRFAIHKLMVAQQRRVPEKRDKDIIQSVSLIEAISRGAPLEIAGAVIDAKKRGFKWAGLVESGLKLLPKEVQASIAENVTAQEEIDSSL